jgi:hypothetical protein
MPVVETAIAAPLAGAGGGGGRVVAVAVLDGAVAMPAKLTATISKTYVFDAVRPETTALVDAATAADEYATPSVLAQT